MQADTSKYDEGFIMGGNDGVQLNEQRALRQTTGDKFKNGLVKMGGTAVTSFLEPFVDLTVGAASAGMAAANGEDVGAAVRKSYDNWGTQTLDSLNNYLNKEYPNYASQKEQNMGLLEEATTANFWADKVGNGLGFMLGAVASGALTGGAADAIKAGRLAKGIATAAELAGDVAKGAKEGEAIVGAMGKAAGFGLERGAGEGFLANKLGNIGRAATSASSKQVMTNFAVGMVGAMGESGMEARQIAHDTGIATRKQMMADIGLNPEDYENHTFTNAQEAHIKDLEEAAGNTGFLYNMALVGGTHLLLLPKIFRKGYQAERVVADSLKRSAETGLYEAAELTGRQKFLKTAGRVLAGNAEEATQEQLQFALEQALPDYYRKQRDPEAQGDFNEYLTSMGAGMAQAYGTKEGWENALLGGIIGIAGSYSSLGEVSAEQKATQAAATTINAAISTKAHLAQAKALVAQNAYAKAGTAATLDNDQRKAEDAAFGGFASMVRGYSQAGKFEDLIEDLEKTGTLLPEEYKEQIGLAPDAELNGTPASIAAKQVEKAKALHRLSQEIEAAYPGEGNEGARDMFFGIAAQSQNNKNRERKLSNEVAAVAGISYDALVLADKATANEKYTAAIQQWAQDPAVLPTKSREMQQKAADLVSLAAERVELADQYRALEDPEYRQKVMAEHQALMAQMQAKIAERKAAEAAQKAKEAAVPPVAPGVATGVTGAASVAPVAPLAVTKPTADTTGITIEREAGKYLTAHFDAAGKLLHWTNTAADGGVLPSTPAVGANKIQPARFQDLIATAQAGYAYSKTGAATPAAGAAAGANAGAPSTGPEAGVGTGVGSLGKAVAGVKPGAAKPTAEQTAAVEQLETWAESGDAPAYVNGQYVFPKGHPQEGQPYTRVSSVSKDLLGKSEFPKDQPQYADRGNAADLFIRDFFIAAKKGKELGVAEAKAVWKKYVADNAGRTYAKEEDDFDTGTVKQVQVADPVTVELTDNFFQELVTATKAIKAQLDKDGYYVFSDTPSLYGQVGGKLYVGTMDLVLVGPDGKLYIADLKTGQSKRRTDYLKPDIADGVLIPKKGKNGPYTESTASKYRESDLIQQAMYQELLEQRTGLKVAGRFILPMVATVGGMTAHNLTLELESGTGDMFIRLEDQGDLGKRNIKELIGYYTGEDVTGPPTPPTADNFRSNFQLSGLDDNKAKLVLKEGVTLEELLQQYPTELAENFTVTPGDKLEIASDAIFAEVDGNWQLESKGTIAPAAVEAGTSYPTNYYAQTDFSSKPGKPDSKDNNAADNAARATYQANLQNPNHAQAAEPLLVQRVQNGKYVQYNVVTNVVDAQGRVLHNQQKVAYLANTDSFQKGKAESPAAAAARAGQQALKANVDAWFAAHPRATSVPLLHVRSASLQLRVAGAAEVTLAQLDDRFTVGGQLRVIEQRTDPETGVLEPRAINGPELTKAERAAILAQRVKANGQGELDDSYIIAVSTPDGKGVRYIGARAQSVADAEYQELLEQAAANAQNLGEQYFLASATPGTHFSYIGGSWELSTTRVPIQKRQTLGFLRVDKKTLAGKSISSLAEFKAALRFYPQLEDGTVSDKGGPADQLVSSVQRQVPEGASDEAIKAGIIPSTGPQLYQKVSLQLTGVGAAVAEAPALTLPEAQPLASDLKQVPRPSPGKGVAGVKAAAPTVKQIEDEEEVELGAMKVAAEGVVLSESFAQAQAAYEQVLGENAQSLGLDQLPANVYRNGQTVGVFLDNVAYFAEQVEPGTGYHEAGHAVFRGFLSPKQLAEIYQVAERRLGATARELAAFRGSVSAYARLTDQQLKELLLEEKVMDGFMAYQQGKPAGFFGKLYRWMKEAIATLLGNRDAIASFYHNMDQGAFRAARRRYTGFEGRAAYKNIPFTTVEDSRRIVGLLTVRYLRGLSGALEQGYSREEYLRALIGQRLLEDTVALDKAPTAEGQKVMGLFLGDNLEGATEGRLYRKAYLNTKAIAVLMDQVLKQEKVLNYSAEINEDGDAADDAETQSADNPGAEIKESFSKGGYLEAKAMANVSQEIRLLLSLTTYTDSEGLEQVVDFDQTASILERILENKRTFDEQMTAIERRVKLGENPQLNSVYQDLLKRTTAPQVNADGLVEREGGKIITPAQAQFETDLFKRKFQQGLYRILLTPVQYTFTDDGSSKAFNADSTNSVEKTRVAQWADKWARSKNTHEQANKELAAVSETMRFAETRPTDDAGFAEVADQYVKAAAKMGVDLSRTFVFDVLTGVNEDYVWDKPKGAEEKRRSLRADVGNLSRYHESGGANPFLAELGQQGQRVDAESRALGLGKADANYHDTILNPSYRNAENKSQYAYTQASYLLEKSRDIQDGKLVADEINALNPLLHGALAADPKSLLLEYVAGVRREEDITGQSFGNMDTKVYLLMGHLAYRGNTGTSSDAGYRRVMYGQLEAKSTSFSLRVPKHAVGTFAKGGQVTQATVAAIAAFTQQQELQVEKVWGQIAAMQRDSTAATEAVKNVHFTKYDNNNQPILPTRTTAAKDLPRGVKFLVFPELQAWTAKERADNAKLTTFANELSTAMLAAHKQQLTTAGFTLTDKKVQNLLGFGHGHQSFDDYLREYLLSDFIYRESYSQLTRGSEAWFKDAVDITKRGGGLIAAGPSFGEGGYQMAPLQTDTFHIRTATMEPVTDAEQAILDGRAPAGLSAKDKVVFGHPTIGKTFLKEKAEHKNKFISLDDDYAQDIKEFIAANKKADEDKYQYQERKPQEFVDFTLQLFDKAKALAEKQGKVLLTSNNIILANRPADFDRVINLDKVEFLRRIGERNTTYDVAAWKDQIDALVAKVDPAKVVNTNGYLEELLPGTDGKSKAQQDLEKSTAKVDSTDAQGYCTARRFAFLQTREARLDKSVLAGLQAFANGETDQAGGGWTGISMKNVYYGQEGNGADTYLKMSVFPLFKEVTSFKAKNGNWVAKPGFEKLHNLRVSMEAKEDATDESLTEAYHDTAIKKNLRSVNFRKADGLHDNLQVVTLRNDALRRQVANPSGKDKVIDPTQLLQILDSGMQDGDSFTYTRSNGEEYTGTVKELRDSFQQTLADHKLAADTSYQQLLSGVVDNQSLAKRLVVDNLEASGADENTLAFFGQTPDGQWALSPDMPVIQQKAQQLVLSGFNKNVFSQKMPGTKRSLVSSEMTRVIIDDATGRPAHNWALPYADQAYLNEDGSLKPGYSAQRLAMHGLVTMPDGSRRVRKAQIMVSEELLLKKGITLAELYGPKTSQVTRDAILTELNLRIPSQDKHSQMPCEIVGWLPAYMGSVVMAPSQITYLSGADYDIDSLFSLQYAFYKGEDGGVHLYGGEAAKADAYVRWNEYLKYQQEKHPFYRSLVEERLSVDAVYQDRNKRLRTLQAVLKEWKKEHKNAKEDVAVLLDVLAGSNPEDAKYRALAPVELKAAKAALKAVRAAGAPITEDVAELLDVAANERERVEMRVRKDLKLPVSYEDFKRLPVAKQESGYARSNRLMDVRMGLALNPHDFKAAASPVDLAGIKKDGRMIAAATGAGATLALPYNSGPVISEHHIANNVGIANTGVAAKANNSGVFLTKIGYQLAIPISFGPRWLTGYKDHDEHDMLLEFDQHGMPQLVGQESRRKQDTSSSHISAATDNAKERDAFLLNLSQAMLSPVMNMVHLSLGRTRSHVFNNQPILRMLAARKAAADSIIPGFEESFKVTDNLISELQAWLNTVPVKDRPSKLTKGYTLEQLRDRAVAEDEFELAKYFTQRMMGATKEELTILIPHGDAEGHGLADAALVANLSFSLPAFVKNRASDGTAYPPFAQLAAEDVAQVQQQLEVLLKFKELEKFTTEWFSPVGRLLALNKGVGSSFSDLRKFREAGDKITPYAFTQEKANSGEDGKPKVGPTTPPFIFLDLPIVKKEHSLHQNLKSLMSTTAYMGQNHILATAPVENFTQEAKGTGLKSDAVDDFQSGLLAHLAVNGYQDLAGLRLADYQYLLTDKDRNITALWQQALAEYPDLEKNPFVYNTQRKKPDARADGNNPFYRLSFNTRADFSAPVLEGITDGITALLTDSRPEVRELMRLTYLYEGVKNNFQFKNESVIKLFPAVTHGKQAQALRGNLANLVGGERYQEQFMGFGRGWYSVVKNRRTLKEYGKQEPVSGPTGNETQWALAEYVTQTPDDLTLILPGNPDKITAGQLAFNGVMQDKYGHYNFPNFFATTVQKQISQYESEDVKEVWALHSRDANTAVYERVPENKLASYQSTYHLNAEEQQASTAKAQALPAPSRDDDREPEVPQLRTAEDSTEAPLEQPEPTAAAPSVGKLMKLGQPAAAAAPAVVAKPAAVIQAPTDEQVARPSPGKSAARVVTAAPVAAPVAAAALPQISQFKRTSKSSEYTFTGQSGAAVTYTGYDVSIPEYPGFKGFISKQGDGFVVTEKTTGKSITQSYTAKSMSKALEAVQDMLNDRLTAPVTQATLDILQSIGIGQPSTKAQTALASSPTAASAVQEAALTALGVTAEERPLLSAFEQDYPALKGLSLAARVAIIRGEDPTTCKLG